ncbi:uncharacterized protein LOC109847370 [Asparagus officinalis]|uniref:uncharacterized protein LOC109847370 n=1 Tax=Asparagus officinalis TaxID=4686 RepID=UPI00098DF769|nr:uncharacterized protein LOC109847370 [Asparagus officinalis]
MRRIMQKIGYYFSNAGGLNFGKGQRTPLAPFVPKGKPDNYYDKTRKGLGYVSPPLVQCFEASEESDGYSISSSSELIFWDSDTILKKNGKIRVCIDFRDLNSACPKDDFALPITYIIIDNTCGFERMSFVDGFLGYNQIKMYHEDEKHTSFRTPSGIYCYTVMPFGLKNTSVIYQHAITTIFREYLRKIVECYVDDLVVKIHSKGDHLQDLKMMFELMQSHQLKMNPTKSFLGMTSEIFFGFVVTTNEIHLDPEKVKTIQELPPPRNLKELHSLQGRLSYIHRFISNLSSKCQMFSKLMKKGVSFIWDEACQKAFEEIKLYLSSPPILVAPKSGKLFMIYVRATDHALTGLLSQDDDNGHEQDIYYLSRTLSGAEHRYPHVKKECLALPSTLNWRLARYALLLSQYDILFKPQKAVKGQVICDLMANQPMEGRVDLYQDISNKTCEANAASKEQVWQLFFDGASRTSPKATIITGVGVVLVSPQNHVLLREFSLIEPCSNNVVEYNALLIGLDLAKKLGVKHLEAYGDSKLVINQLKGKFEVRHVDLVPYHETAIILANSFKGFYIDYVPHLKNTYAGALASLAATLALPKMITQRITVASKQLFWPKYAL